MNKMIVALWIAGALQLVIAAANVTLPGKLQYRENLVRVSPMIRQIFVVHSVYIVLIVIFFAALCLLFAPELAEGAALARCLTAFLAVFWALRVPIQLFYYDAAVKRQNRLAHVAFTAALISLAAIFAAAALGVGR